MYLQRGRPHGRLVLVVAAALAGAAAYLPVTRYSKDAISYDSQSIIAVKLAAGPDLDDRRRTRVAIGITIGAAARAAHRRRLVAGIALPVAIAISVLITIPTIQWDIKTHGRGRTSFEWVDHASAHRPVTLIATPSSSRSADARCALLEPIDQERSRYSRRRAGPTTTPRRTSRSLRTGHLLNVSTDFLYNRQGTHATIDGARSSSVWTTSFSTERRLRRRRASSTSVKGQLSNGFLSPYCELDVWGSGRPGT